MCNKSSCRVKRLNQILLNNFELLHIFFKYFYPLHNARKLLIETGTYCYKIKLYPFFKFSYYIINIHYFLLNYHIWWTFLFLQIAMFCRYRLFTSVKILGILERKEQPQSCVVCHNAWRLKLLGIFIKFWL